MRIPPAAAQLGERSSANLPTFWSSSGLVELLGLGRAALQQPDGGGDVEEELQVLALPVLGHVDREVRRDQVAAQRYRPEAVGRLLGVERLPPRQRMSDEAGQEAEPEEQAERVVAESLAHEGSPASEADGEEVGQADEDDGEVTDEHHAHLGPPQPISIAQSCGLSPVTGLQPTAVSSQRSPYRERKAVSSG